MESPEREKQLGYDWTADLIAMALVAVVTATFVLEWFYWTGSQSG